MVYFSNLTHCEPRMEESSNLIDLYTGKFTMPMLFSACRGSMCKHILSIFKGCPPAQIGVAVISLIAIKMSYFLTLLWRTVKSFTDDSVDVDFSFYTGNTESSSVVPSLLMDAGSKYFFWKMHFTNFSRREWVINSAG